MGAAPKQHTLEDVLHIEIGGNDVLVRSSVVREVSRPGRLTSVPMGPEHLLGMVNIHGQIVCIIDAARLTSLPSASREMTSRTRFLLLRHPVMHVGIWADAVKMIRVVDAKLLAPREQGGETVKAVEIDGVSYSFLDCSALLR